MTTQNDMYELAMRRSALKRKTAQAAAGRAQVDTSCLYLTLREIAQARGLSIDQARYAMRNIEPVKARTGNGICSYAFGYAETVVNKVFEEAEVS